MEEKPMPQEERKIKNQTSHVGKGFEKDGSK